MLTIAQPQDGCGEVNKGQKMRIQLVVARSHATKLLEAAEEALDGVALGVAGRIVGPWGAPLAPGRNQGLGVARGQGGYQRVGIVAAVGDGVGRGQTLEQRQGLRDIVALACAQPDAHEPTVGVGQRGELGSQAPAAALEGLWAVFFAGSCGVLVGPHGGRIDQQRVQGVLLLHDRKNPRLDAGAGPALEARVRCMPVAAFFGQRSPPRPVAGQPEHGSHEWAVVRARGPRSCPLISAAAVPDAPTAHP